MGVKGLYKFISQNPKIFANFDLVKEAEDRNGIEILIDFNNFYRTLVEIISRKIAKEYNNKYLVFTSGEYDIFSEAISDFHRIFNEIGIKFVWILDGPKGVDKEDSTRKAEIWKQRDKKDIDQLDRLLNGCCIKRPPEDLNNLGPMLGFELSIESLKRCGAEIIQLLQGQSDDFIAAEFIKRKSFAVITGDTDFLVFSDCKVIFPELMIHHYGNYLNLPFIENENSGKLFKAPNKFLCPLISHKEIFKLFNFTSHDQIIALSIIKGNDNTEDCAQKLQYYLKITKKLSQYAHVTQVANYIAKNRVTRENIYELPRMDELLKISPQIRDTIKFCFEFYNLKLYSENNANALITFDPDVATDSLTDFIQEKLSKSEISKKIYSAHKGVLYDAVIMEKPSSTCPSNSSLMGTIRSKLYSYVVDAKLCEVIEWRSRDSPNIKKDRIEHAAFKTNQIKAKPDSESGRDDSIIYGIDLFEDIWSHLEPNGSLNFVRKFGLDKGFVCYVLRYFYKLTKDKNLKVTEDEFTALFITVFYQFGVSQGIQFQTELKRDSFLRMEICPTEKCLIIYSWFMNIYYTAKYLSGGALNLTADFPSSEKLMSTSVLYAVYEFYKNDTNKRLKLTENSIGESVQKLGELILEHYSDEYDAVITQ